jgi:hypothetical protein
MERKKKKKSLVEEYDAIRSMTTVKRAASLPMRYRGVEKSVILVTRGSRNIQLHQKFIMKVHCWMRRV